ncbi:endonuclease/exonuclease/phosphatase domain-containing protein [Neospora caninum Liverpool]|uniref:Endonuclease/exonuclease/phosphatase domain-containing protein n=1 Tax=Neospora caninum (strain Liverpool) TaxID=572307 RepID=F0VE97_NEOCL|nr:endonuclease/exonuclease/phosphatase domain-containing protein [Neospora caninum Liverpool]CBZ52041.1 endonuclease/exonuclease/phosphatase domain-containing protein [Neospora caninum Liverpool]|eukprot:XP_003882073.1 endonuclease/exonuclease/phosphatase domain-containing protein [Neospora caninum Liverpool]
MESRRAKIGEILVTRAPGGKLLLTFFWHGQRLNLERSEEEPLDRLLQRLRLSCKKVTQKRGAEEGRKGKAARKQRKKAEASSPGAQATPDPGHTEEKKDTPIEDLQHVYLRRKDGTVAPGDEACGVAVQRAAFVCFSSGSPFAASHPIEKDGDNAPPGDAEDPARSNSSVEDNAETEHVLEVVWNPPVARCIYVPQAVYTGCPVLACVATEHANEDEFVVEWRYDDSGPNGPVIHRGPHYTPKPADEGRSIALKAYHPLYSGFTATLVLPPALPCPSLAWHCERVKSFSPSDFPPSSSPSSSKSSSLSSSRSSSRASSLRVCSFNILAGAYARTPHAVQAMYPYCSGHHLDLHHRKALLGKELCLLNADIVALQECSSSLFSSFLAPLFKDEYHAFLQCKFKARVQEGCALLVRKNCFSVLKEGSMVFQKELLTEVLPHLTTVMQFAVLRRRETDEARSEQALPKTLIVANTHLFFHPYARHIRVLQLYVMAHFIQALREEFAASGEPPSEPSKSPAASSRLPPVIMCGDFNCQPGTGGLKLLQQKTVHAHLEDWRDGLAFRWEMDEDAGAEDDHRSREKEETDSGMKKESNQETAVSLSLPSTSPPAASAASSRVSDAARAATPKEKGTSDGREQDTDQGGEGEPGVVLHPPGGLDLYDCYGDAPLAFSNFVAGFQATLDYIYASSDFKVVACLPGVGEEAVRAHGGLPCRGYPSDHLAIAVDLQLQSSHRTGQSGAEEGPAAR